MERERGRGVLGTRKDAEVVGRRQCRKTASICVRSVGLGSEERRWGDTGRGYGNSWRRRLAVKEVRVCSHSIAHIANSAPPLEFGPDNAHLRSSANLSPSQ
jgi:hypothetical protein